ncbi:hypothetical protein FBUS_08064 [Fasciolopsis buskii]|uniref:Uncharacterized protein n=1 Tax=Fasciolopsis buskii TaxID=27845 RepID=A0A8E0RTP7_9TREM|nr:hypothetical protein FBUS_08064 [Fasciolopsis buski]
MGLLGKILCLIACAVGVVCTLAPIIQDRDRIRNASNLSSNYQGSVGCMFIAFFIFAGGLIFLFITLCCSCSDICMGILIAVVGGGALFFTICAYALLKNSAGYVAMEIPTVPEWLFGSIVASTGVILCSLTLAVS